MSKMNNARKGLMIAGIVLALTIGILILKNFVISPPSGLYWTSTTDLILASPMLILMPVLNLIPQEPAGLSLFLTFGITIAFWLLVGYGIGYMIDKKKKSKKK